MNVRPYPLVRGLASYLLPKKLFVRPGSGGSFSSEYCYSVWQRHLHYLIENKLFNSVHDIKNIAEIGPGDSLGIGISALYSGADNYYAFDVIKHSSSEKNKLISREICSYYELSRPIPNTLNQKDTHPILPSYEFPKHILNYDKDYYLSRKSEIENALDGESSKLAIEYIVPWMGSRREDVKDIDLIFSQAVMEHVDDLEFAYGEMFRWLKKGGVISHQIDFKTHEMTKEWNGHWFIDNKMWKILSHGRKYPMNRLPLSAHIKVMQQVGFDIRFVLPVKKENKFKGVGVKVPEYNFIDDDLITSGALIQAIKV